MARCEVCGRPYDGGTLLSREIPCQGCHAEYVALQAVLDGKGARVHTDGQALSAARQGHYTREEAAHKALILSRFDLNAAGKDARDGSALAQSGPQLAQTKATAATIAADLRRAWGL